ncbi:MAG: hypothetical protein JRH20_31635, partial [Deltaproteobacteria bacterium]|nr:hypothetical protein [Deltaproteobacteria bacterium]
MARDRLLLLLPLLASALMPACARMSPTGGANSGVNIASVTSETSSLIPGQPAQIITVTLANDGAGLAEVVGVELGLMGEGLDAALHTTVSPGATGPAVLVTTAEGRWQFEVAALSGAPPGAVSVTARAWIRGAGGTIEEITGPAQPLRLLLRKGLAVDITRVVVGSEKVVRGAKNLEVYVEVTSHTDFDVDIESLALLFSDGEVSRDHDYSVRLQTPHTITLPAGGSLNVPLWVDIGATAAGGWITIDAELQARDASG